MKIDTLVMKKLSLYVFLVLMFCNISFAETYVCITDDKYSETTTFTRSANNKFEVKLINEEGSTMIVDLYDENKDFLVLAKFHIDTLLTVMINKREKTYSGIAVTYPNKMNDDRIITGNCSIIK